MAVKKEDGAGKPEAIVLKSADVGYSEKPMMSTAGKDKPSDETKAEAKDDANTVFVQAVRSFAGEEGDKGPASEPFAVSRQRYADLKANGLVELIKE